MYPIVSFFTVWFLQETTISKKYHRYTTLINCWGDIFLIALKRDRQNIYILIDIARDTFP